METPSLSYGKRALHVDEFCERYGIGRTKAFSEMAEGRLRSVAVGRRRLIPVEAAEAWFASLGEEAA